MNIKDIINNKLVGLIFYLVLPLVSFSQDSIRISYGDKINLGKLASNFDFEMDFNEKTSLILGAAMNEFTFDTPGTYLIRTKEKNQSKYFGKKISNEEHDQFPAQFFIFVDSLSVNFIAESIKTSRPIKKGIVIDGLILSIECELKKFGNRPISFIHRKVKASGIGANLYGELIEMNKLDRNDIYLLTYSIQGICSEAGYVQFDFEANGQKIIPIGWREEIR